MKAQDAEAIKSAVNHVIDEYTVYYIPYRTGYAPEYENYGLKQV